MGDKLVSYVGSQDITKAVLQVLREKGLSDEDVAKVCFEENKESNSNPDVDEEQEVDGHSLDDNCKDDDDDIILGELFSKGDTEEIPQIISKSTFCQAVLMIKGVVSLLSQNPNIADKNVFLDVDVFKTEIENENIVYLILSYISNFLFGRRTDQEPMEDGDLKWINEGVKAVVDIVNESIPHPFIMDALEICREFVKNILENLCCGNREANSCSSKIVKMFGAHKTFGKLMVTFLLEKFLETGDLLREAEQFKFEDESTLVNFHIYREILLEIWPEYAEIICDGGTLGANSSRKRKEKVAKPRLSLSETLGLVAEIERWIEMLSESTRGLSIVQPDFYLSVQTVIQFLNGTLLKLNRQKM